MDSGMDNEDSQEADREAAMQETAEALMHNPGLAGRVLGAAIGVEAEHYQLDGTYWPYPDLDLRCPRCPACGAANAFPYGPGMHPQGMCSNDDCNVLMFSPLRTPMENLVGGKRLVETTDADGRTIWRPEEDPEGEGR